MSDIGSGEGAGYTIKVLEGGYDLGALADSVLAMIGALGGRTERVSIAPDPFITSRVAARVGHFWSL